MRLSRAFGAAPRYFQKRRLRRALKTEVRDAAGSSTVATDLRQQTLDYLASLAGPEVGKYRYSTSASLYTVYSSAFACMTRSLLGDIAPLTDDERAGWVSYFDRHQDAVDGLWRDPAVSGPDFEAGHWWGARHLAPLVLSSYDALGSKPKLELAWMNRLLDASAVVGWLEGLDWDAGLDFTGNEVLNYGSVLQIIRDNSPTIEVQGAVKAMLGWLEEAVDPSTGLWGPEPQSKSARSRAVQAAYHFWLLFAYEGMDIPYGDRAVEFVLRTQNELGGYGVSVNSSACEDIDSIDPLVRLMKQVPSRREEIEQALRWSLPWVLVNHNGQGAFSFRRGAGFEYGSAAMSAGPDEGSVFATWFRTLSLAYMTSALGLPNDFTIRRFPGYEIAVDS